MKSVAFFSLALPLAGAVPYSLVGSLPRPHGYTVKREDCPIPAKPDPDVLKGIYEIATGLNVTPKVLLATFETCWVESHCWRLKCGDQDSVGIYQQRKSQGWGTIPQLEDLTYSTNAFLKVAIANDKANPGYTAGQLAQSVQRSEFPTRYEEEQAMGMSLLAQAKALAQGSSSAPTQSSNASTAEPTAGGGGDASSTCSAATVTVTMTVTGAPTGSSATSAPTPTSTAPPDDGGDDGDDEDCDSSTPPAPSTAPPQSSSPSSAPPASTSSASRGVKAPSNVADGTPKTGCSKYYTVKSGDTCSAVAKKNKLNLNSFYALNKGPGSDCQNLFLGQAYCVAKA